MFAGDFADEELGDVLRMILVRERSADHTDAGKWILRRDPKAKRLEYSRECAISIQETRDRRRGDRTNGAMIEVHTTAAPNDVFDTLRRQLYSSEKICEQHHVQRLGNDSATRKRAVIVA
jgi:hypothetical protein